MCHTCDRLQLDSCRTVPDDEIAPDHADHLADERAVERGLRTVGWNPPQLDAVAELVLRTQLTAG